MSVWTNWDPLTKVIVGQAYAPGSLDWYIDNETKSQFNQILHETREDLDKLAQFLTNRGITVYRPDVETYTKKLEFSKFSIVPTAPIVPRDQYLVYGNTVYQTYTSMPDRYIDSLSYYSIFKELFDQGLNWISQPPPILENLSEQEQWWTVGSEVYKKLETKLLWHTATAFKCGDAIISNTQGPGTAKGYEWFQRNTPNTRFYDNKNTIPNNWGHIDHGWFMIDDNTVIANSMDWVPEVLRNKECIIIGEYIEQLKYQEYIDDFKSSSGKLSSEWINKWINQWLGYWQHTNFDTNVLVLDPKNILFSRELPELFDFLEKKGITCHSVNQRHSIFWDSGIHCCTLDVERLGSKRRIIS
jgi:hypothetical protein